jgi:hypothetical protein
MKTIRWIFFIPVGILAGVLASAAFRFGTFMFPEIIRLLVCGATGAGSMIFAGLYVAPVRCATVKWTLVVLAIVLGVLSVLGTIIGGRDKLEVAIGIATVLTALALSGSRVEELAEKKKA